MYRPTIIVAACLLSLVGCGDSASAPETTRPATPDRARVSDSTDRVGGDTARRSEQQAGGQSDEATPTRSARIEPAPTGSARSEPAPTAGSGTETRAQGARPEREPSGAAAGERQPSGATAGGGSSSERDEQASDWPGFGIWDDDADIRISRGEFLRGVNQRYPMWRRFDADDDGAVSRAELVGGLYRAWRRGDSLSGREVRRGASQWFDVDWSTETIDDGDAVSRAELDRFLERRGVFEALDRDGDRALDTFEMGLAFFEHWDLNGDGFIDEVEWHEA